VRELDKILATFRLLLRDRIVRELDKILATLRLYLRDRIVRELNEIVATFRLLLRDRIAWALDKTMATMLMTDKFQHLVMQIQFVTDQKKIMQFVVLLSPVRIYLFALFLSFEVQSILFIVLLYCWTSTLRY